MARREYPTVLELVGHTPIVRLERLSSRRPRRAAREARVPEPGRLGEGPDRARDGRGGGAGRAAAAGRHDRRADLGQHRRRPRDGRRAARLPLHLRDAGQDEPGEDLDAARVRGRGRHHADRGRPALAGELLRGLGPARRGDPRRLQARPVLESGESRGALRDDRARALGADRRRRRRRRSSSPSEPAARSPASGATSRSTARRALSSRSIPRAPSSPPTRSIPKGRTSSRASARSAGPTRSTRRSSTSGCASRIATRS